METTRYFREQVQPRRPEIHADWCAQAIARPGYKMQQGDGRIRYYLYIAPAKKFLRVVTLEDGQTVHNAFFDRNFKPKEQ